MKRGIILSLLIGAVTLGLSGLMGVYADKEEHDFKLFKREGMNPYTLTFPFRVLEPGEMKVFIKVEAAEKKKNTVQAAIMKKTKKKPVRVDQASYDGKHESMQLRHAADSLELKNGKDYEVVISNFSGKHNASGTLLIVYNGKEGTEEGAKPVYPDLTITDMRLNNQNMLQVEIVNKGPGRIPSIYYDKNVPDLFIYRDAKGWGGVNLKIIDPGKKLSQVGGKVTYTLTGMKVSETEKIRAVIDSHNTLKEENEKNNEAREELSGKNAEPAKKIQFQSKVKPVKLAVVGKPDLVVSKIYLTGSNNVAVEVVNKGPGRLSEEFWKYNGPTLYLHRGQKGWGGAVLFRFDPAKKLMAPGGKVVYVSNLKVSGSETIKAVIDSQNTVPEANDENNEMTKTLSATK
jgi:hypothetical protein